MLLGAFSFIAKAQAPVANFTVNRTEGCGPLSVQFTDASTGNPTSWTWDFGEAGIFYGPNPRVNFAPGTYTVRLVVSNADGADDIVKTDLITAYKQPKASFDVNFTQICLGRPVDFKDLSTPNEGTISTWSWNFGDKETATIPNPSHQYDEPGFYTVQLKVTNSNGCSHSTAKEIRVIAGITSDFTAIPDGVCKAPFTVNIKNETAGPGDLTYSWNLGNNGPPSTAFEPTATYNAPGNYTIKLTTTSEYGCSNSIEKTITIQSATTTIQPPATICLNAPATFSSRSDATALSTSWKLNTGATEFGPTYTHTFSAPGTYTLRVFNDYGFCKDFADRVITINPLPAVDFIASIQEGCKAPFSTQFTANTANAGNWLWKFGDGTTSSLQSPTHSYETEGSFPVSLTFTDQNGCSNEITKNEFIKIIPPVIITNKVRAGGCVPYVYKPSVDITSLLPVTSYSWDFGDGSPSKNGPTPTHTYSAPGSYTVTVTITTAGGCTIVTPVNHAVRVGTPPQTAFSVNNTENCLRERFQFINNTVESQEWLWDFGDGTRSSEKNPSHQYPTPGIYTVSLTSTNNGCSQTISIPNYITVRPPRANFTYQSDCGANMRHFKFSNNSVLNPAVAATYLWKFNAAGTETSDLEEPSYTFPDFGTYEVSLTVTQGACSHTFFQKIEITNEKADFIVNNSTNTSNNEICRNASFTLKAINSNADNIHSYTWTIGNTTTTGTRNFARAINTNGNYDVALTIVDQNGCPHTVTKQNFLNIVGPFADFSTTSTLLCLNKEINFIDKSTTDNLITKRAWDFGDGTHIENNNPQINHAYTRADDFITSLVVTDQRGCTDAISIAQPIHITAPIANFTAASTTFCPKLPLKFHNTSQGENLSYRWSFGDGNSADIAAPEHTYEDVDKTYTVLLEVTDQQGCTDSKTLTNYITAITPKAAFSASDDLYICPPSEVFFTNESKDYKAIRWNFDNGNTSSKEEPLQFFNDYRNYTVRLYAIGIGGCEDVVEKIIHIANPRDVKIDYSPFPAMACNELLVDFNLTLPADGLKFRFNFGDETFTSDEQLSFSHLYNNPNKYNPTIILSDRHSCEVPVRAPTIEIRGSKPTFSVDKREFCDEGIATFKDLSIKPSFETIVSRLWTFGDAASPEVTTSNELDPVIPFTKPGVYPVTLTLTTASGCTSTFSELVEIKVYRTPQPTITAPDFICVNDWAEFLGTLDHEDKEVTWKWEFSNRQDATQSPTLQFTQAGTQQYKVTASNVLGCSNIAEGSIIIYPLPKVQVPEGIHLPSGGNTILPLTYSSDVTKWRWEPASTLSCPDCPQPIANPQFSTTYKVSVETLQGCKSQTDVPVKVVCSNLNLFVPNTFSPNNDGINDIFYPRGTGIDKIASMRIYNRAGLVVFERKNFVANDPNFGWNGEFKGKPSGADTYIYTIELICENAEVVPYKGNITLVR